MSSIPRQRLLGDSSLGTPVAGMRSAWGLISAFWRSDQKKKAWLLTGALAAATVADIAVNAGVGYIVANVTNAFQSHTFDLGFAFNMAGLFLSPFASSAALAKKVYMGNIVDMEWRRWLFGQFESAKKMGNAMYHVRQLPGNVDHPDQAITQGPIEVAARVTGLGTGLFTSGITILTFTGVMLSLCEKMPIDMLGQQFNAPGPHFWFGMGAALLLGTLQTRLFNHFGKPFDKLNLRQTRKEGALRTEQLTTFNESGKIVGYGDKAVEAHNVRKIFQDVMSNLKDLATTRQKYTFATDTFNKETGAAYLAIGGYLFAATKYSWGQALQITMAINTLQTSCAWFGASKPSISEAESWVIRMVELAKRLEEAQNPHTFYAQNGNRADIHIHEHDKSSLLFKNIVIDNPKTNQPTLTVPELEIEQGERIMVIGKSGTGKSCLLKIPFEQYYYGEGECFRPRDKKMTLAEPHILDSGTLRANLAFPESPEAYTDAEYKDALEYAELGHLVAELEAERNYARLTEEELGAIEKRNYSKLSNGEKQRLICARIMLNSPDIVVLDEGFSAMDPALQMEMCRHLMERLPNATIIAVVHAGNETLQPLFNKTLEVKDGVIATTEVPTLSNVTSFPRLNILSRALPELKKAS